MKTVLIVEDQNDMWEIYKDFFDENFEGINVVFSPDGVDAYMKCATEEYDSIILDHNMPRLKGLDLLLAIRLSPGPNQNKPIFVVSAFVPNLEDTRHNLKDIIVVEKPINFNLLSDHFKRYLE